jgi:hypothetical protein
MLQIVQMPESELQQMDKTGDEARKMSKVPITKGLLCHSQEFRV